MNAIHSFNAPIFDRPPQRKLKSSFWIAVMLAAGLHIAGGLYLVGQKFLIPVTEKPHETITTIETIKPKPPEPTKPVTTTKPVNPKPLTVREPVSPIPDDIDTAPIAPSRPDVVVDPGPPVITEPPVKPGTGTEPGPVYVTARWTRFPDSEALLSYYPTRATDDEIEGQATVECTVADDKGRVTCQVLSEAPPGYGFGKATARMVQDKGRVDVSQGDVRVGSKLRTTVKWTLQ